MRPLGKTGLQLPVVSMGVMNSYNPELVKRAYEKGIRHFDTAANYERGRNEEMVGSVIQALGARDQVIVATKVYIPHAQRGMSDQQTKDFYLSSAEASLKRLRMDHVEILYAHSIRTIEYLHNAGVLDALRLLKQQGKARFIGFSTHANMAAVIEEGLKVGFADVILTSYNFVLAEDPKLTETIAKAAARGVGVVAMKTQCTQGPLGRLKNLYYGSVRQTALLKWVLQHDSISTAIPGFTTFTQLDEDWPVASNLAFTPDEREFLGDPQVRTSLGVCRQCSRCIATCPAGVEIPELMRVHMYAAAYANFHEARRTFDEVPARRSIGSCESCDECRARCAHQIDIARRIGELRVLFG
jgi:predicted aldo/keto reductase-like oxidoreductase